MAEVQYFNTVPAPQYEIFDPLAGGQQSSPNLATFQVGFGGKVLRVDQRGIWLGAKNFATAPFSVDMDGNVIANSITLNQYLSKAGAGQVLAGSINLGNGNVKLDGANKRIIINDGSFDRVLIGYHLNGF